MIHGLACVVVGVGLAVGCAASPAKPGDAAVDQPTTSGTSSSGTSSSGTSSSGTTTSSGTTSGTNADCSTLCTDYDGVVPWSDPQVAAVKNLLGKHVATLTWSTELSKVTSNVTPGATVAVEIELTSADAGIRSSLAGCNLPCGMGGGAEPHTSYNATLRVSTADKRIDFTSPVWMSGSTLDYLSGSVQADSIGSLTATPAGGASWQEFQPIIWTTRADGLWLMVNYLYKTSADGSYVYVEVGQVKSPAPVTMDAGGN